MCMPDYPLCTQTLKLLADYVFVNGICFFMHFALYDSKNQQCIQANVFPDNEQ